MADMKPPIPILRSFDEAAMRAFYLDFLEFEVVFEHRFGPGAPLYLSVKNGDCEIHLSEHYGDATPGSALRIETKDVAGLAERFVAKKFKFAGPGYQDQGWGWREMAVKDPSSNRLVFCERID